MLFFLYNIGYPNLKTMRSDIFKPQHKKSPIKKDLNFIKSRDDRIPNQNYLT